MSALTVSGINITGTLYNSYREQQELINEQMIPPLPNSYLFWFSGYHPPINGYILNLNLQISPFNSNNRTESMHVEIISESTGTKIIYQ